MGILIDSKPITITTELWDGNHEFAINNAILMQIQVKPTTTTTTFDIYINDVNWMNVYSSNDNQWEINELVNYPVYWNQTIYITNASIDEAFSIILTYRRS